VSRGVSGGHEIGKKWAITSAEHDELKRVKKLDEVSQEWRRDGVEVDMRQLTEAINDDGPATGQEAEKLAELLFGCEDPDEALIRGFIDGAVEVFDDV